MSKRRQQGEIVVRRPGSGFLGAVEPRWVQVPFLPAYASEDAGGEAAPCILCDDPDCREWANLKVVGGEYDGKPLHHIGECEMEDAP